MHTVQVAWKRDDNGRMKIEEIEGTEKRIEADLVLLAMGFLGPEDLLGEQFGLREMKDQTTAEHEVYNQCKMCLHVVMLGEASRSLYGLLMRSWCRKAGRFTFNG